MSGREGKTIITCLIIVILVFDQAAKYIVCEKFYLGQSVPIIKDILHITYVRNTGAAFGILKNQGRLFSFIGIAAIIFIIVYLFHTKTFHLKVAFSLILAGTISNLIDRLRYNAVVDFLDVPIWSICNFKWPVFNFADSAITIGAVLLAYNLFVQPNKIKES